VGRGGGGHLSSEIIGRVALALPSKCRRTYALLSRDNLGLGGEEGRSEGGRGSCGSIRGHGVEGRHGSGGSLARQMLRGGGEEVACALGSSSRVVLRNPTRKGGGAPAPAGEEAVTEE
jgi:hypothetical protein